jgi:hypothetical protein
VLTLLPQEIQFLELLLLQKAVKVVVQLQHKLEVQEVLEAEVPLLLLVDPAHQVKEITAQLLVDQEQVVAVVVPVQLV